MAKKQKVEGPLACIYLACIYLASINPDFTTTNSDKWHPDRCRYLNIYGQWFQVRKHTLNRKRELRAYPMAIDGEYLKIQPGQSISDARKGWQFRILAGLGISKNEVTAAIVAARIMGGQ